MNRLSRHPLHTYLNDHLAGSVAALELLDHLIETEREPEAREFFVSLQRDIAAHQEVLKDLLRRLDGTESRLRKAGAWISEKIGEIKLRMDEAPGAGLRELEACETLALGLQGQIAMWTALEQIADRVPEVRTVDLASLLERTRALFARVESRRIAAVRKSLGNPAET